MSEKKLSLKNEGSKYFLDIIGVMDEDLSYNDISLKNPTDLIVSFEKVASINSCGIREWIRWVMQYPSMKLVYQKCPKMVVDQINMVDGFLPHTGTVESFYVPYYNEETSSEAMILFTFGKEFDNNGVRPPAEVLDAKGNTLEMDVIESKYFRFLTKKSSAA